IFNPFPLASADGRRRQWIFNIQSISVGFSQRAASAMDFQYSIHFRWLQPTGGIGNGFSIFNPFPLASADGQRGRGIGIAPWVPDAMPIR
ncbi:MAG TPA: hypothetical protein VN038_06955, partial [Dyadobacter sp.]|nr:hypothetical protein [Dyadobacter sp.]